MSWDYLATRLNGDGTEDVIAPEVPLSGAQFLEELSAPGGLSGTVSPQMLRLTGPDGRPVFEPFSTALYASVGGRIRWGARLTSMKVTGAQLALECEGFTSVLSGEPYDAVRSRVGVDPMDEYRHIWEYFQSQQGKNYGLTIDDATSPIRVGTEAEDVEFTTGAGETVAFEAGPYKINYWSTQDLGKAADDLATVGRFDYRTEVSGDGESINKFVRLDYPRIGRRLEDRYVVGENVLEVPTIDYSGEAYASQVVVLGSGEGRKMMRGVATRQSDRMGRTVVVVDDSLGSDAKCKARAVRELRRRQGKASLTQFTALAHTVTADVGDEILFQNTGGWAGDEEIWVRVMGKVTAPESPHMLLEVVGVDAL